MNNPMSNTETVQAFMQALEARNFAAASSYLADDFIFSGATPKPLNKGQFMTVIKEMKNGIPDLAFRLQDVHQRDNTVTATMQITGTQAETFLLAPLGMPPVPQMGRSISLPKEHAVYAFQEGQIMMMDVEQVPGGGIPGMLQQLGIDLPIIQ